MRRHQKHAPVRPSPRERGATRAGGVLVALIWLWMVADGASARPTAKHVRLPEPLRIDPWTAPPWRLRLVPGIGARRAARIVRARLDSARGPWASLEDLVQTPGIDAATRGALRQQRGGVGEPPPSVRLVFSVGPRDPRPVAGGVGRTPRR